MLQLCWGAGPICRIFSFLRVHFDANWNVAMVREFSIPVLSQKKKRRRKKNLESLGYFGQQHHWRCVVWSGGPLRTRTMETPWILLFLCHLVIAVIAVIVVIVVVVVIVVMVLIAVVAVMVVMAVAESVAYSFVPG